MLSVLARPPLLLSVHQTKLVPNIIASLEEYVSRGEIDRFCLASFLNQDLLKFTKVKVDYSTLPVYEFELIIFLLLRLQGVFFRWSM